LLFYWCRVRWGEDKKTSEERDLYLSEPNQPIQFNWEKYDETNKLNKRVQRARDGQFSSVRLALALIIIGFPFHGLDCVSCAVMTFTESTGVPFVAGYCTFPWTLSFFLPFCLSVIHQFRNAITLSNRSTSKF